MKNEYLWDRGGPPDPEIEALERRLAPLRFSGTAFKPRRTPYPYAAIAASIVIAIAAWRVHAVGPTRTEWAVTGVTGDVSVGMRAAAVRTRLHTGQTLATGETSTASVENEEFGQVDLHPESKLTLVESKQGRQTMSLEHGRLHAFIWAPPRQFVVNTPSARTIDLGCEYDLTVDANGNGLVSVETGWVAFQFGAEESFIPEGAACRTTQARGPGIPFYRDAAPAFLDALKTYDATLDVAAMQRVLAAARSKDGLSLWHLLNRVPAEQRPTVFDRFVQLVPVKVDRASALAKDPQTMDLCWNALQLDDAGWWREWKREWKPGEKRP